MCRDDDSEKSPRKVRPIEQKQAQQVVAPILIFLLKKLLSAVYSRPCRLCGKRMTRVRSKKTLSWWLQCSQKITCQVKGYLIWSIFSKIWSNFKGQILSCITIWSMHVMFVSLCLYGVRVSRSMSSLSSLESLDYGYDMTIVS